MRADWRHRLEAEFEAGQAYAANKADWLDGRWAGFKAAQDVADDDRRGETGVNLDRLKQIGERITAAPEGFNVHKTILRFLENRRSAIASGDGIDWSTAEALAFGSLLDEGLPVRLSGQDTERGTFSQRHSVLIDQQTEARYIPLNHIRDGQARYEVINSMLSEEAVLGFEYGYSLAEPNALTAVGGAVRRLRQRRAGRVRPVHLGGRAQVAAHVGARLPACRTATRDRVRSIRRPASSAFCSSAARTTCRSSTARRRPISSMRCAASSSASSASR